MKSIILDIFNGKCGNIDSIKEPERDIKKSKLIGTLFSELEENLSKQLFEKVEKLVNATDSHWIDEADHYFIEGFKLGLLIGVECAKD